MHAFELVWTIPVDHEMGLIHRLCNWGSNGSVPISLFVEKKITSEVRLKNWNNGRKLIDR